VVPTFAGVTGDGTGVNFSWWAVKGATRYEVLRTANPQQKPTVLATLSSTTLGYRDPQPAVGPSYYQLIAILAGGARATGAWFEYIPPVVRRATMSGADVVLSWSGVKSAPGGYEVWRTPNPRQRPSRVAALDATTLTYRDKQAGVGPFYYQVVAIGRGGTRAASGWFAVDSSSADDAAALAAVLAAELAKVGVAFDSTELDELKNAMIQGGSAAMQVAMVIENAIAVSVRSADVAPPAAGDPVGGPTGGTVVPSFQARAGDLIATLSTGNNASLQVSQILLRKLKLLAGK
jgi:hypothetical protein